MSVIRLRALQRLAAFIESAVPELSGVICGGQATPSHRLVFPSLAITAVRFTFYPDQATEHYAPANSTRAVFNVGRVEGTVQLRLGAATNAERYRLEQAISEAVWWADIDRPGIVLIDIPDCDGARVAFEQDADEWQDERAFDREWYSTMTCALQMPALVAKLGVETIEEIRLQLTEDLTSAAPAVDEVVIDETGLLFPVSEAPVVPTSVLYGYGVAPYGIAGYGVGV